MQQAVRLSGTGLRGRLYTASRSALGVERGNKLISATCRQARESDSALSLAVVERDI
jgi:hypothetical protein